MKEHYINSLKEKFPGPRWLNCGLDELVAKGERFDVVTMYHVLEHISGPLEFLQLLNQLCAPGALIVIEVPNVGGFEARIKGQKWHYYKVDHVNYFRPSDLHVLARKMGWEVLAIKGYQHFSHPQNVLWKDVIKASFAAIGFKDVTSIFARVPK